MSREAQENSGLGGWWGGKRRPGGELLRAGQRWFCRGTDESLERWVLTGREEGGDGEERREEGSVAVMLKPLHGCRTTCDQHPMRPLPSPQVPATPSVVGCTVYPRIQSQNLRM